MTRSPGPTPAAASASQRASVPEAQPTACFAPTNCASSCSSASTSGPSTNCWETQTRSIAARISSSIPAYCRFRSRVGTPALCAGSFLSIGNSGFYNRNRVHQGSPQCGSGVASYSFSYLPFVSKSRIPYAKILTSGRVSRKLLHPIAEGDSESVESELHFGNSAFRVSTNSRVVRGKISRS